ncbi:MAG: YlxR family protein [Microbacteriaceae bacterium]|nr:YlxR family protein [Microbacteriaceae bacterium]
MEPVRTCVGCRQRASRTVLLRVVCLQQELKPDSLGSLPGRGAWLHASSDCLTIALDRKAFGRALKSTQQLDASALITFIEQAETMLATNE